jgi:hypothetical protein
MSTPRTQEEILARMEQVKNDDIFGTQRSDLIDYLTYENAAQFLKDGVTAEQWDGREKFSPRERMTSYMDFAWEKAIDKRGLSAMRSMQHYTIWLWLDGDDVIHPTLMDYEFYGKDELVRICEYLGLDASKWDDGVREND